MRSHLLRIFVVVSVVVALSAGVLALAKKPGGNTGCPTGKKGWFCPLYYAPVVCGPDECWYSNQCFANIAGWDASECTPVGPGPVPL